MVEFYFVKKKFIGEQARIWQIFRRGVEEGWGANRIQQELMREGLGYRRKEILHDYALYKFVRTARTPEGQLRAMDLWERLEQWRIEWGLTREKALRYLNLAQTPERATPAERTFVEQIVELKRETFPELYH